MSFLWLDSTLILSTPNQVTSHVFANEGHHTVGVHQSIVDDIVNFKKRESIEVLDSVEFLFFGLQKDIVI